MAIFCTLRQYPAKGTRIMDEILRYTDLAHAIQLARAHDLSDRDIVRALTGSMSYEEARKTAQ